MRLRLAFPCSQLNWTLYPRVTSAAIARSPKGALVTRADQKGASFLRSHPFIRLRRVRWVATSRVIAPAVTLLREGWSGAIAKKCRFLDA